MATLFIIFATCAILSLVYETCVVPAFRTEFENELFEIRDELRAARMDGRDLEPEAFGIMTENVNNAILAVHRMDGSLLSEARHAMKADSELFADVSRRVEILNQCADPLLLKLRHNTRRLTMKSFLVGSGGLLAHVLPLIFVVWCWAGIKEALRLLLALPEGELSASLRTLPDGRSRIFA